MSVPIEMWSFDISKLPADLLQVSYVCGKQQVQSHHPNHEDVPGLGLKTKYSFIRMSCF